MNFTFQQFELHKNQGQAHVKSNCIAWADWASNINSSASAWATFRSAVRCMKTIVTNRGLLKPIRSRQEAQFGWKMRVSRLCGSRRFLAVKRHRYRLPQLTDSSDGETWSCSVVHQQFVFSWDSRALDKNRDGNFFISTIDVNYNSCNANGYIRKFFVIGKREKRGWMKLLQC